MYATKFCYQTVFKALRASPPASSIYPSIYPLSQIIGLASCGGSKWMNELPWNSAKRKQTKKQGRLETQFLDWGLLDSPTALTPMHPSHWSAEVREPYQTSASWLEGWHSFITCDGSPELIRDREGVVVFLFYFRWLTTVCRVFPSLFESAFCMSSWTVHK